MPYDGLGFFRPSLTNFGHDKSFVYESRGFKSIEEHDDELIRRFNFTVEPQDDLYLLGDLMLNDNEKGLDHLSKLNGKLHIIFGNHDTPRRQELYQELPNVVETLGYGAMIKSGKWSFLLSHYPSYTGNFDDEDKPLKYRIFNLHGHTHDCRRFEFMEQGWLSYNVAVDAHDCYPVDIENIKVDIRSFYSNVKGQS